jgi:tripartite-type tricarboxylate transporter receptor subunit TctC
MAASVAVGAAHAYPAGPIHLIVTYPAGGATDTVARLIAQHASGELGVQVLVENRPGGSGTIGLSRLAKALPDGQTIGIGTVSSLAVAPRMLPVDFDAERSFEPVCQIGAAALYAVTSGTLGVSTLAELARLAKTRPQGLSYASVGEGTIPHIAARRFAARAGVEMVHVPYAGSPTARVDLIAGRVDVMFDQLATFLQSDFDSGRLKALAVLAPVRPPNGLPVPTAADAGFPGLEVEFWLGVLAPAGTPTAVVDRLNAVVRRVLADDKARAALAMFGIEPRPGSPADFRRLIGAETARWAQWLPDERKR